MRKTYIVRTILAAVCAIGVSCTSDAEKPDLPDAPTHAEAGGAEYSGIYDHPILLVDGRYEGEPFVEGGASRPVVLLINELFATGDIDGDGIEEAVVLLVESSGGSGSFLYLAVLSRRDHLIENVGTSPIGDRVQIRSLSVNGSSVVLDVVQNGPDDAACCPTMKALRTWTLGKEGLVEKPPELKGTLSIKDLEGVEWVLREFNRDEPAPVDVSITLIFQDDGISGFSGCNRYFAEVTWSSPGETVKIGPIGSTKMNCAGEIMEYEDRYLKMLGGVFKYSFLSGRLALTCIWVNDLTTMTFEKSESQAPSER